MDSNGYLSTEDTEITEYDWDHRNRLTTVADFDTHADYMADNPNQVVDYIYDHQNRLVRKTLDNDGDGSAVAEETYFIHDGNQIALQFDGPTAADLTHRYLWGAAVDQILADETVADLQTPGEVLWPLTDHLNTVRDLADSTGAVTNHLTYDAYGNITSETNAAIDHLFAFTARMFDKDTGLQNNLNRWYDAAVGRWLSEDPIGFGGGDANLYRYVGNGPLTATDPSGLWGADLIAMPEGPWGGGEEALTDPTGLVETLGDLSDWLERRATSEKCKAEAKNIAAAIQNTFDLNNPWYFPRFRDQRNKGYYCYEWAYGFEDAAKNELSGDCFTVKVEEAADAEGHVHFWIVITPKEKPGYPVYVDDGFADGDYVHHKRPIPTGWTLGSPGDVPRSECCPAPGYDANGDRICPPAKPGGRPVILPPTIFGPYPETGPGGLPIA